MELKKDKFLKYIDQVERHVHAIDSMISAEWLSINIYQAYAAINPYLYAYCNESIEDSESMFRGLATMIRTWINIGRSIRRGELIALEEEEGANELPLGKHIIEQNQQLCAPLQDSDPLTIVVVNYNGDPIVQIKEVRSTQELTFDVLKEKKVKEGAIKKETL
jgi:hypothetical protein